MPENSLDREVLDRLIRIETKLDSYGEVKEQVYKNQRDILKNREKDEQIQITIEQQQKEIDELKDNNKWLSRTLAAAIITVVVAAIVFAIRLGAIQ